jgi:hypothetical protein
MLRKRGAKTELLGKKDKDKSHATILVHKVKNTKSA